MDTDSDSDGSHISATPPGSPAAPLPPPPNPFASVPILCSKTKSRARIQAPSSSCHRSRISKRNPIGGQPSNADLKRGPPIVSAPRASSPSSNPTVLPSVSLPIRHHNAVFSASAEVPIAGETLVAGSRYFSTSKSFSRIGKRASIDLNSVEGDIDDNELKRRTCEAGGVKSDEVGSVQPGSEERIGAVGSEKRVKKPSNLIGVGAGSGVVGGSLMPPKRPNSVNEGNFVKLNIGGRGRFSKYKGKKRRPYKFKTYRRGMKSSGTEHDGECNENGLMAGALRGMKGDISSESDKILIEEAVLKVRNEASDDNLLKLLKITHGYDSFHDGQLQAVKMVLAGKSTMLVLPTGAGKSLCYQLPAIVIPGVTLVISPLVALMIDQLKHLPPMISGALLCNSQSREEVAETLQLLQEGAIKVLFVSPERLVSEDFISMLSSTCSVSLMVVDEAHCISEWSHNFRPSYMRLRQSILCRKLNIRCVLAMTATATIKTLQVVMSALDIQPDNLVKRDQVRSNLQLSVSLSENKMKDLVQLIKSPPFSNIKSIIIYCKFQYETDLISKYLRDSNIPAKSYHSGILAKDRSRIQASFCSSKLRVVVATVAFGMGLDKSDIGAVINYSLPESLEEYVQEIGRAGRDGRLSYCHLFVNDLTYFKLRSLMFSDGVEKYQVNKFLCQVFSGGTEVKGKVRSLIIESTSRKFDIKEEVMLTILTQLELGKVHYLSLLPQINITCCLSFHRTPVLELAHRNCTIATILKRSETKRGQYSFDIPTTANDSGLSIMEVLEELKDLKFTGEITYELKDPAFCYAIISMPEDICSLAAEMTAWLSEVESCKVRRLDSMYIAASNALKRCKRMEGCNGVQHTTCLQRRISDYFHEANDNDTVNEIMQGSPFLRADIKVFLQTNSSTKFTPRAVARILHGIGSPAYPSSFWSKAHFWGRYSHIEFNAVMIAAQAELISMVGQKAT